MKILPFDVAVIENDTHISKWVQQAKTIEIAKDWPISLYKHLIPQGGVVVDAGAFIGDHTVTYAKLVGGSGKVYAFEPNPIAFECLKYNTRNLGVACYQAGLGDDVLRGLSVVQDANSGASHLALSDTREVIIKTLDNELKHEGRLDFIKMDVEGFEVFALEGARSLIRRFRPVMFIEVNPGALNRAGTSWQALYAIIGELGYSIRIVPHTAKDGDAQYDILCQWNGAK